MSCQIRQNLTTAPIRSWWFCPFSQQGDYAQHREFVRQGLRLDGFCPWGYFWM